MQAASLRAAELYLRVWWHEAPAFPDGRMTPICHAGSDLVRARAQRVSVCLYSRAVRSARMFVQGLRPALARPHYIILRAAHFQMCLLLLRSQYEVVCSDLK